VFCRETLEHIYGLHDPEQKHWDTWNGLKHGPSEDIGEYTIEFQQTLTDLADSIADEEVKIEKHCSGLRYNLCTRVVPVLNVSNGPPGGLTLRVAPLLDEQKKLKFDSLKLYHKCHQPSHQLKQCPFNKKKVALSSSCQ
jgi:hypothetical protein